MDGGGGGVMWGKSETRGRACIKKQLVLKEQSGGSRTLSACLSVWHWHVPHPFLWLLLDLPYERRVFPRETCSLAAFPMQRSPGKKWKQQKCEIISLD